MAPYIGDKKKFAVFALRAEYFVGNLFLLMLNIEMRSN